ncbi:hypothetical protein CSV71_04715 [Sporosarcina sp. P21c]|uniref:hypothetical protein n=1 Tax=unclassified Sporosarcina TaxID=2647733 RepID=UPI000C163908|nr:MULTISPECIES: hypothetical protein [unclassified Sporosarcina]PIC68212.1 hypothetical protein CSV78_02340 [Sporosarcina sp. P16a]PIC90423.1 hypothetical protein CSV71_04715 [Sporosarcina sp. P21c]PIC93953.1 hypothetical protein CSV70_02355 [Sporosarcina sp. P25]
MKKSFHWKLITGYLVLLMIGLVVAETMERQVEGVNPPEVVANEVGFDLYNAIVEELPIPENLVLAKRSHEVEGKFSIPSFTGAYILIKRTSDASRTIEETVYSPELMLMFNEDDSIYYDLSDQLNIKLPVWDSNSMSVPTQPENHLEYTFYHDSNILNQFTGEKTHGNSSGTVSGVMTIHLSIPESIELDIPELNDEQNYYIDVLE